MHHVFPAGNASRASRAPRLVCRERRRSRARRDAARPLRRQRASQRCVASPIRVGNGAGAFDSDRSRPPPNARVARRRRSSRPTRPFAPGRRKRRTRAISMILPGASPIFRTRRFATWRSIFSSAPAPPTRGSSPSTPRRASRKKQAAKHSAGFRRSSSTICSRRLALIAQALRSPMSRPGGRPATKH